MERSTINEEISFKTEPGRENVTMNNYEYYHQQLLSYQMSEQMRDEITQLQHQQQQQHQQLHHSLNEWAEPPSGLVSQSQSQSQSKPQTPDQQQRQSKMESQQQQQQQQQSDKNPEQQQQSQQQQQQTGDTNRPKRNPFCSRCRNHGKSAQVKGHKRHCEYRDCQCEGCKLVECRQIVSAAQIKRRRYQKQDEECGRRIEVSPPILTRTPNSDPAALIAKTLINSKALLGSSSPNLVSPASGGGGSSTSLNSRQLITGAVNGSLNLGVGSNGDSPTNSLVATTPTTTATSTSSNAAAAAMAAAAALQNRMINLPTAFHANSAAATRIFAAAAANMLMSNPQAALLMASNQGNPTLSTVSTPMPDIREQLNLVEEIHQSYGPLAVYAWLREEQFDLAKVRHLIEIARNPFDDLLQFNGHSPIDLTSPIVD